ncbi:transcriptional regulatory protein [Shewanella psychrophila]|uniref:Transcriptional regulatory protein n=1 Tax=Shewanella psychrophila TaxID=225848 RepID=A0A1S6HNP8_9GAMM|nr:winged helix-turn-helix domain-containing protein [Shewanella psychrophila]AQS37153.1 transcriptional regulatory protein [Shewanella psychrophila]
MRIRVEQRIIIDFSTNKILDCPTGYEKEIGTNEALLLKLFTSRPNQLLSKEEIIAFVWKDRGIIVEEGSLLQSISACRKLLDDKSNQLIKTVRGKGYQFEGEVSADLPHPIKHHQNESLPVPATHEPAVPGMPWLNHGLYFVLPYIGVIVLGMVFMTFTSYLPGKTYQECYLVLPEQDIAQRLSSPLIYESGNTQLLLSEQGSYGFKKGVEGVNCSE